MYLPAFGVYGFISVCLLVSVFLCSYVNVLHACESACFCVGVFCRVSVHFCVKIFVCK